MKVINAILAIVSAVIAAKIHESGTAATTVYGGAVAAICMLSFASGAISFGIAAIFIPNKP